MRAFIAIPLNDETKKRLTEMQSELEELDAKLVESENFHLTLKFLGTIEDDAAPEIAKKLSEIKFKPFKVVIDTSGVFPSEDVPNVAWIGGENPPEMEELKTRIDAALSEFKDDHKEHKSHITLARIKNSSGNAREVMKAVNKIRKSISEKPIEIEINEFKLYKSTLLSRGPVYEEINL